MADAKYDKTVFLTGFPGFIAGRLVERLARSRVQFFLLVEDRMLEAAALAVERIASAASVPLENFALIPGDITLPDLGISPEDMPLMVEETTDVFHLAAVYDLAVEEGLARRVNVEGTRNVNDLVRKLGGLRRYNYISTCSVAGRRTGVIRENELEHDAGFRNFYEETKYLAELEVEKLKAGLPVTIFRPSVVVGDSRTGETAKYDGIYYLIHYLRKSPGFLRMINVGNRNVRLNLVPVDFVVDAIAALSDDAEAAGRTVALADPAPLTTSELFDTLAEKMTGRRSLFTPPPALVQNSLMLPVAPAITGLPHSGVPYFFLAQSYDTSAAEQLLAKHGITCPRFPEYAGNLLDFVAKHPQL